MINAVGPETPTASDPNQMKSPKATAQIRETTPWSMLGARRCTSVILIGAAARAVGGPFWTNLDQKNSPSRFRFRPPVALTFGFRLLPSPLASTYSRSVLGANGNLAVAKQSIK